jgi:molecular chaperone GrpE
MSSRRGGEGDGSGARPEGWESLAEEASVGSLKPSPELEEALREAAEALEQKQTPGAGGGGQGEAAATAEPQEDLALELKQTQDRLLRLHADFENFRRRALKERTEAAQYSHQNLVKDLLSAVDNLERAIEHAGKGGGDLQNLLQGVELVRRQVLAALAKNGVTQIEALGKPFDPSLHEAMAQVADTSLAPNTVVEELEKGYKLRDRLVRPARVVVSKLPQEAAGAPGAEAPPAPGEGEETA